MNKNILQARKALLALFVLLMPLLASAHDFEVDGIYYNITSETDKQAEVTFRGDYYYSYSDEYSGSITFTATVSHNGVEYSVTSIGGYAFQSCSSLTAITIPEGVTSIEGGAFSGCSSLTAITIPEGVTSIGGYAFYGCSSLTAITIPEGVTSIGGSAFSDCSSLTAISVAEGNTIYDSRGGCNAIIETSSNTLIRGCSTTIIPESVTSIGDYAFSSCSSLTAITIPEGVTSIGNCTFSCCSSLTTITIPDGVMSIKYQAFSHCSSLTTVTIPESVTSIGSSAFEGCSNLTTITIPESVTSIEVCAFRWCSSLIAITIPKGMTSIEHGAFEGCIALKKVIIEDSNETLLLSYNNDNFGGIGEGLFYDCPLETVYLGRNLNYESDSYYGYSPFYRKGRYPKISLGENITTISPYLFYGNSDLTTITIPKGVTRIGNRAFFECRSLTAITCKATTPPSIGSFTFYDVRTSIPVYVPAGSVEAYQSAADWHSFSNILPLAQENDFTLTVSSAGYATLFLDYAAKIPDNVKAYIGTRVEGNRLMMTRVTGVLPANTGVIVRAEAGTYTFEESKDMPANVEGNLLSGTATDTYITAESGYKYYVLAQKNGLVAMYRPILTDGRFLNNANKAYIALDTNRLGIYDDEVNTDEEGGQLSNSLRFDFGGTTIIENPLLTIDKTQIIYDLHGRRVTDTEGLQGIYIIDGRKVVIK